MPTLPVLVTNTVSWARTIGVTSSPSPAAASALIPIIRMLLITVIPPNFCTLFWILYHAGQGTIALKTAPGLIRKPDLRTTFWPACRVTLPLGSIVRSGPAKMASQATNVCSELIDWFAQRRGWRPGSPQSRSC